MGHRRFCGKGVCPILVKAESLMKLERSLSAQSIFGSSPPAVFIGSWNYPKVLAGPLVPPVLEEDTSVMDQPERWLNRSFEEILSYRMQLVRGELFANVRSAANPDRVTSTFQEIVMASQPIDTEMWFNKKPRLSINFSSREAPSGPSAKITRAVLAENPSIPRAVDDIISDTDLKAREGILTLYDSNIGQQQITRILSVGLLGVKKQRKLVPTEWSITAIDDILGKALHREILRYPWINQFMIFGHNALANNVQIMLLPSSWMFEAQEAWLTTPDPIPDMNYEFIHGRRSYASDLAGAYYAARLPVLEYLRQIRRQAGAIVLMEVYPDWIPLGVWRFRELCREALKQTPIRANTLEEALSIMTPRLRLNLEKWVKRSEILRHYREQTKLTSFTNV